MARRPDIAASAIVIRTGNGWNCVPEREEILIDATVAAFDNGCTLETPTAFKEKGFVEWVV
jgi:hypothetical protein